MRLQGFILHWLNGGFPEGRAAHLPKMGSKLQGTSGYEESAALKCRQGSLGQDFPWLQWEWHWQTSWTRIREESMLMGDESSRRAWVGGFPCQPPISLDNLTVIIDGTVSRWTNNDVMSVTPIDEKLKGFQLGGHDHRRSRFWKRSTTHLKKGRNARASPLPSAKTVKGKGVSFMKMSRAGMARRPIRAV